MAPGTSGLPVDAVLPELLDRVAAQRRCLLVAQPGAGKTTRVPLALLESGAAGGGRWLLLEPRRVAARLAAGYMAASLGEEPGGTVGYRVRGDSKVSRRTRLEVVTQGVLTRMLQDDPSLEGVAGLIFDEFHERSLEADLGLALALDVQGGLREDLRILLMSATLDTASLLDLLGPDTALVECRGRAWPVDTRYRPARGQESPEQQQVRVLREALEAEAGDLLVFLPGQREIRRLQEALSASLPAQLTVLPLHGQLPLARQQAVLRPPAEGGRRIILSTAIAESSVTVPGVRIVIDAGRERVPVFQARSGLSRLQTRQVNRASADQRRGRAGREAPGLCYRLWPEDRILVPHREPEILQADLAGLVFELAQWGLSDPGDLRWPTPPPAAAWQAGRGLLRRLGLLQADGRLTELGRACTRWPTHPRLALMLEQAAAEGQLALACWLCAWLEEGAGGEERDLGHLLEQRPRRDGAGAAGRWYRAARQWAARAGCDLDFKDSGPAGGLLAWAYPDRLAQNLGSGRFRLVGGGQALLPPEHALARADFLVVPELDGEAAGARIFHAIAISRETLESRFLELRDWRQRVGWDEAAGRLRGEEVRALGALVLERRPLARLPGEAVRRALLEALRRRGALPWSEEDRQLLGRLRLLRRNLGEPWPEVSEQALLARLEDWLLPHLEGIRSLDQVAALPLGRLLLQSLDWRLQRQLEELAPTHLEVPSGSRIRLDYDGEDAVLAVKLQEMFGQRETPRLVGGRVPVLVQLLSPARRPVQVTRDLASFWAGTYFEVRKDLKGRYPKHPWPDNPLEAQATARTRRKF